METEVLIAVIALMALSTAATLALAAHCWRRVQPGTALLVNTMHAQPRVLFGGGAMVLPVVHKAEVLDLAVKRIVIARRGKDGMVCADYIRADVEATFLVRINPTAEDVLAVARSVGCARAADPQTLAELFTARFAESLKIVAGQLEFETLHREREQFKDQVIAVIGTDLNGYILDDVAVDLLEQTALEHLDPDNVLDAKGIKKIKALTELRERAQEE